jgi:hypothetical protein
MDAKMIMNQISDCNEDEEEIEEEQTREITATTNQVFKNGLDIATWTGQG